MNRIMATGRPVRDCVLADMPEKTLCKFCLACKADYFVDGKIKTNFIRCVAWDKTAEVLANNVKKGDLISVSGTLDSREYEKESNKELVWEIRVERVEFLAKAEPKEDKQELTQDEVDKNLPF